MKLKDKIINIYIERYVPNGNGYTTKVTEPLALRVGGHKKVISYFLRNGVASVTPFPVSAVLPQE